MNRRQFLKGVGATMAGTTLANTASAKKQGGKYTIREMQREINELGTTVVGVKETYGEATITHISNAQREGVLQQEMANVIVGWTKYVTENFDVAPYLTVTLRHTSGRLIGWYEVTTWDARDYANGKITATEFAFRVTDSIEMAE